ncbi:hypothetical protein [Streptomyces sp. CBMA156]|uniref:hypothetical protein n=1 Tax=Streptomyces sp. CBMA156 TaxID=1930280 RepID=UPI001661EBBD|nr:hypothetical protein [Streptomyces sp. CBMA156]
MVMMVVMMPAVAAVPVALVVVTAVPVALVVVTAVPVAVRPLVVPFARPPGLAPQTHRT